VTELEPLMEAVSEFASRAAEKLRKQDSLAGALQVFMHTSPHRAGPQLSRSVTVPLRLPTADSRVLAKAAADGMRFMYVPGFQLIKAGVFLMDLQPAGVQQRELELEPVEGRDRTRLMAAMDALNGRFGKGTLHVGSTGLQGSKQTWGMRQERRTPQYTTRWEDVPVARA
jgi:DNA polymerase V